MICTYCQTNQENKKVCSFCGSDLAQSRPQIKQTINLDEAYQNQPGLSKHHTYDLLLFLRHIRAERTDMYKVMQITRKAPEEAKKGIEDYEETKEDGINIYRELTARKNIIEQIIIDRLGYFPKRIDNKLLSALDYKIKRQNNGR